MQIISELDSICGQLITQTGLRMLLLIYFTLSSDHGRDLWGNRAGSLSVWIGRHNEMRNLIINNGLGLMCLCAAYPRPV